MTRFESLRLRSEFDKVKMTGRRESSGLFTLLWIPSGDSSKELRACGIICSRKFDVRAVRRNRARRLFREALRLIGAESLRPCRIVIIPRRAVLKVRMQEVKSSLEHSLKRAGLLRTPEKNPESQSAAPSSP